MDNKAMDEYWIISILVYPLVIYNIAMKAVDHWTLWFDIFSIATLNHILEENQQKITKVGDLKAWKLGIGNYSTNHGPNINALSKYLPQWV